MALAITERPDALDLDVTAMEGRVELRDVWFRYPEPRELYGTVTHDRFGDTGVRIESDDVGVVGRMMNLAQAETVGYDRISLWVPIWENVRGVEEPYLLGTHDGTYRTYAARVGRFVPGLGRITGPTGGDRNSGAFRVG